MVLTCMCAYFSCTIRPLCLSCMYASYWIAQAYGRHTSRIARCKIHPVKFNVWKRLTESWSVAGKSSDGVRGLQRYNFRSTFRSDWPVDKLAYQWNADTEREVVKPVLSEILNQDRTPSSSRTSFRRATALPKPSTSFIWSAWTFVLRRLFMRLM